MALVSHRFAGNDRLEAAARNSPSLKFGATGKAVEILQRSLIELGFAMPISTEGDSELPDGIYGQETVGTVRKFQSQQGLQPDGIVGQKTLGRLDQLFEAAESLDNARLPIEARANFWT